MITKDSTYQECAKFASNMYGVACRRYNKAERIANEAEDATEYAEACARQEAARKQREKWGAYHNSMVDAYWDNHDRDWQQTRMDMLAALDAKGEK